MKAGFYIRIRYFMAALMFVVAAVAFLDKQSLSVLEKTLEKTLEFSPVEYGYIVAGLLVATAVGYLFAGGIIDRFGAKYTFAAALVVWSVAAIFHAYAASWVALFWLRVVLGFGEAFYTPVAAKAIKEWIPQRERGICWAIFSTGNFVGAILAVPIVAGLAHRYDWQTSFIVTGGSGFVLLLVWLLFYNPPEKHRLLSAAEREEIFATRAAPTAAGAPAPLAIFKLLKDRAVLGFFFTRFFSDSFTFFFLFSLPRYLQSARSLDLKSVERWAWIPYVGAAVGALATGLISDALARRGVSLKRARKPMLLTIACLTPLSIAAVYIDSLPIAMGLLTFVQLLQGSWNTNLTTLIIEYSPAKAVASITALALMGGAIGGVLLQIAAGYIIAANAYVPIFIALGVLHMAAYGILSWGLKGERSASKDPV